MTLKRRPKQTRLLMGSGYVRVFVGYDHPKADPTGFVYEHTAVAERAIGRYLPDDAEVHHVNEVRSDNRGENLVICQDKAYHKFLHARLRRLRLYGDVNRKRCAACGNVFNLSCFYPIMGGRRHSGRCKECVKLAKRNRTHIADGGHDG